MTMHLVQGMSSLNTRKRKTKLTDNQLKALEVEWRQYNKRMRKSGCHSAQFDEFNDYVAYTRGEYKPKLKGVGKFGPSDTYKRETPDIPSLGNGIGNGHKRESPVYSGERQLLGVATMHKSNMVPIFADNKEQAKEIAQMRR